MREGVTPVAAPTGVVAAALASNAVAPAPKPHENAAERERDTAHLQGGAKGTRPYILRTYGTVPVRTKW
jgi:hypothetical protein